MKATLKHMDELPATLQAGDVADYLGLSKAGVYQLSKNADFPAIKIGRRVLVPKEAFIRWIEENTGKQVNVNAERVTPGDANAVEIH